MTDISLTPATGTPTTSIKKRYRLERIRVDEISLVDNAAVPGAEYLIAKRDENATSSLSSEETGLFAPEDLEVVLVKSSDDPQDQDDMAVQEAFVNAIEALRDVAHQMDADSLSMLSQLMEFTSVRFGGDDATPDNDATPADDTMPEDASNEPPIGADTELTPNADESDDDNEPEEVGDGSTGDNVVDEEPTSAINARDEAEETDESGTDGTPDDAIVSPNPIGGKRAANRVRKITKSLDSDPDNGEIPEDAQDVLELLGDEYLESPEVSEVVVTKSQEPLGLIEQMALEFERRRAAELQTVQKRNEEAVVSGIAQLNGTFDTINQRLDAVVQKINRACGKGS